MKRMITGVSLVAAMLLMASSVMAEGLSLAWNACALDGGVSNKTSACTSNLGNAGTAVGTFNLDADHPGITGVELIVDFIAQSATMPAWWQGSCRTPVTMNAAISGAAANCFDWANGGGLGGVASIIENYAYGVNTARIIGGFAVAPPGVDIVALPASSGTEYFAFNMVLSNTKTTGTGSCAGCATPMCLVFNNVKGAIATPGVYTINIGAANSPSSNVITWQGAGADCAAVPTKNTTWSQVKSLYR
jgi:hypothetical protein